MSQILERCRVRGLNRQLNMRFEELTVEFLDPPGPLMIEEMGAAYRDGKYTCSTVSVNGISGVIDGWSAAIGREGVEAMHRDEPSVADLVLQRVTFAAGDHPGIPVSLIIDRLVFLPTDPEGREGDGI